MNKIESLTKNASNIYNMSVVLDYFCENQQDNEALYNITPIVKSIKNNADIINSFFINNYSKD